MKTVMQMPQKASDVLALMASDDEVVRLFADDRRVYLENADTLVSAALWAAFPGVNSHPHLIGLLKDSNNIEGPTFRLSTLADGVKSILKLSGFASDKDKGSRGFQLHAVLGSDSCVVELGLSEADARDEFDVDHSGAELEFYLSSKQFEQMLGSLSSYPTVQALRADNMLVLRSQGIWFGVMEEVKK
jgi:hypothetical protein